MRRAAILFISLLCAGAAHAQGTGPRREDPLQTKLQKAMQLEMLEASLTRPPTSSTDRNAVLSQIKEDFWRIQLANDQLNNSVAKPAGIDIRLIARSAAEIRTRARRLKENLALPHPKKEDLPQIDPTDLRPSIAALSKLIDAFVGNPMLSQRHVIDTNLSLQASRDLENIIILSGAIRKSAGN